MTMQVVRLHWSNCLAMTLVFLCGCDWIIRPGRQTGSTQTTLVSVNSPFTSEEIVENTFNLGAHPTVSVQMFLGSIEIVTGHDDTIHARITKHAGGNSQEEADAGLKELSLTFDATEGKLHIVAAPPENKSFNGAASARVEVPAGANLELKTSLDHITATGVHGSIQAQNSQGAITLKDVQGAVRVNTTLAGVEVEGPSDKVVVKNSQGSVVVRGATGTVDLTTSLAQIEVDGPATDLLAKNSQGAIKIRRATGSLDLSTTLAGVDVDAPCTKVVAQNSQGNISVTGAKGPIKLRTSLAPIVVNGAEDSVDAVNSQGAITIHGATGRINAKTSLSGISLEARDAVVDAENGQGTIDFTGNLAPGKHSFRTSLGNVSLTLPSQASFDIDATVSLGAITNSFPLSHTQKSSETALVGTVGTNPDTQVKIYVSQGSALIQKQH